MLRAPRALRFPGRMRPGHMLCALRLPDNASGATFMSDRPGIDPSKPDLATVAGVRLTPANYSDPNELMELAARFASRANGGLSPELSAELALEILLNEIAEQACLATGATGAAIALQRDGEMVCRATSGTTAPDLGSRVDLMSGLSGQCVLTRQTQRCEDVMSDPQADVAASERLGVRAVIVTPLLQGEELIGVFELFSSLPFAFSASDENTLQGFAQRVLHNIERSKQPLEAPTETVEVPAPVEEVAPELAPELSPDLEPVPAQSSAIVTWALVVGIVLTAMLLGMALGRHWMAKRALVKAPAASRVIDSAANQASTEGTSSSKTDGTTAAPANPSQGAPRASLPPGSLVVYENGKQIFHATPQDKSLTAAAGGVEPASAVKKESGPRAPALAATVLYHVDPSYPEAARQQRIQGPVVLDVYIAKNGSVQGVQVVSGPPELSDASITAVKQWRFKPVTANGNPAEMQTRVTLNYVLPK